MRIEVYRHPFESLPPDVYEVSDLAMWMIDHYGETPSVRVQVFEGKAPSGASEITGQVERLLSPSSDTYTILESPAGLDPFSWAIFAIAAIAAIAAVVLMPKPSMPSNVNRTQSSPNNSLTDRNNQLRLLQRVEDIYGTVRAIPSLMMPTYNKYISNRLYEYGYYCIGRGYLQCTDVRDSETRVSEVDGASAAIYYPFTSPGNGAPVVQIGDPIPDAVLQARRAEEVDGVTLRAPNQVQLPAGAHYSLTPDVGGDLIVQLGDVPNFTTIVEIGDEISISMVPPSASQSGDAAAAGNTFSMTGVGAAIAQVGWLVTVTGFVNGANNVTNRTITSFGIDTITVSGAALVTEGPTPLVNITVSGPTNWSGTYEVLDLADRTIRLSTATHAVGYSDVVANISVIGATEWTSWVTLPDPDRQSLWANVIAAQGLYKDDGSGPQGMTIGFELQSEKLDPSTLNPTGAIDTVSGGISGNSSEQYAVTLERQTTWNGPVRVRMRRTTNHDFGFGGTVIDEIKWQDLYAVTPVSVTHFGNKTTIHTVTRATDRATSLRNRQINCIASRLLPLYNGISFTGAFDDTGRLVDGNIYPTSQISDIIPAVSQDPEIGRRVLSTEIDIRQIYDVNQAVNAVHPEAGQFNYTFDSDLSSFEETISIIANAAFCIAYRQNGMIRLAFDSRQSNSTALFTHRNKKPRSDSITRRFASDSEYDGVEFVYQDPDTETSETIVLPLNGSYTKLKKFEIPGIRSYEQAWIRACREYYKLIGQRLTLNVSTTGEARALLPNSRIDVTDSTRYKTYDGEIVGQAGLEVRLSRDVVFQEGDTHSLVVIKRDGSLESIPVTPGSNRNSVLLSRLPQEDLVTQYGPDGVRTIFSFAPDSGRDALAWLVQEIDQSDRQYVGITAINYSDSYYQMDTQPIPPKADVINAQG